MRSTRKRGSNEGTMRSQSDRSAPSEFSSNRTGCSSEPSSRQYSRTPALVVKGMCQRTGNRLRTAAIVLDAAVDQLDGQAGVFADVAGGEVAGHGDRIHLHGFGHGPHGLQGPVRQLEERGEHRCLGLPAAQTTLMLLG